jgi:hypothetical protein
MPDLRFLTVELAGTPEGSSGERGGSSEPGAIPPAETPRRIRPAGRRALTGSGRRTAPHRSHALPRPERPRFRRASRPAGPSEPARARSGRRRGRTILWAFTGVESLETARDDLAPYRRLTDRSDPFPHPPISSAAPGRVVVSAAIKAPAFLPVTANARVWPTDDRLGRSQCRDRTQWCMEDQDNRSRIDRQKRPGRHPAAKILPKCIGRSDRRAQGCRPRSRCGRHHQSANRSASFSIPGQP